MIGACTAFYLARRGAAVPVVQSNAVACAASVTGQPGCVVPDEGALERLTAFCVRVSPVLAHAPVLATGACYRPVTGDGLPLIGAVPGSPGCYVATGHRVWGCLNVSATGEAMAELVLDGAATTVNLSPLEPGRSPPLDAGQVRLTHRLGA